MVPTGRAIHDKGGETRGAKILVHGANGRGHPAQHIQRPRNGEGGDRRSARQGFQHHQAESVGAGGKDHHIRIRVAGRQRLSVQLAEETHFREAGMERRTPRSIAHHHL